MEELSYFYGHKSVLVYKRIMEFKRLMNQLDSYQQFGVYLHVRLSNYTFSLTNVLCVLGLTASNNIQKDKRILLH